MAMKGTEMSAERKTGLTYLLIFISSPLEKSKKKKIKAGVQFFDTVFKNPDIYTINVCLYFIFSVHNASY